MKQSFKAFIDPCAGLLPLALCMTLAAGCANQARKPEVKKTEIPTAVPELRPGLLAGYLAAGALPNSLALLPPSPAPGSAAFAADNEAYRNTLLLRGSSRYTQATKDADLRFPQSTQNFACALDAPISPEVTPHLYMLLRRSFTDAGLATYAAKDHYKRMRPFVMHNESSCTPQEEAALRNDGSYPSGHAAIGWTWALLLTEVSPERTDPLLARGLSFGQSRVICGAHWQSDVTQGRVMAAGTVARMRSDPVFRAELEEAKKEVTSARQKAMRPAKDCAAETAALGQR
jgi:acid phosphatase (class A)